MKRAAALLALTVALALTACSALSSGVITKKVHEPAYTYFTMQCASYNSKGVCTVWIQVPHYQPERWRFDLIERADPQKPGDRQTGWVHVPHDTFDAYEVGDYFEAVS